jgi:DNA-binding beta-propeller fold protein YncE
LRRRDKHRTRARTPLVYVASNGSSSGAVYAFNPDGATKPVETIVAGISAPAGIALDSAGTLYVANPGNNTVTAYAAGTSSPNRTLSDGVAAPEGVAVDADGTVYVANEGANPSADQGTVTEYPTGASQPSLTITQPGYDAFAAVLDASNNLYVSWFSLNDYSVAIYRYAPGSSQGTNLNLELKPGSFPAYALLLDRTGDLLVPYEPLDHNPPKYIGVFPPGSTKPSHKIQYGGLMDIVMGMAFNPDNTRLFESSTNDHNWMKLTYPRITPRAVVNVGLPTGLAYWPGK